MFSYIFFGILAFVALFCLVQISVADMRRRIIPDVYLWPFMLIGLVFACWGYGWWPISPHFAAAGAIIGYVLTFCLGMFFDFIHRNNKNTYSSIGLGDVKLIAAGGIWLGIEYLGGALVCACLVGLIWGLWHKQRYIPFGTFFGFGVIWSLIQMFFLV